MPRKKYCSLSKRAVPIPGHGDVKRDRHPGAHAGEGLAQRVRIECAQSGDRDQHQDEAQRGAEQGEAQQRFRHEKPQSFPAVKPIGQDPQKQRLINPAAALRASLGDEIGDVPRDRAARWALQIVNRDGGRGPDRRAARS